MGYGTARIAAKVTASFRPRKPAAHLHHRGFTARPPRNPENFAKLQRNSARRQGVAEGVWQRYVTEAATPSAQEITSKM